MDGNGQQEKRREPTATAPTWGYAQEQPNAMVGTAVQALRREGIALKELTSSSENSTGHWARALAECVARGECQGGVVFCQDPGLVCCVANKLAGLRAVPVMTVSQTGQALLTLAANLVAVQMPGRTFFEIRQILRLICSPNGGCPDGVACTLRELDGHAHR